MEARAAWHATKVARELSIVEHLFFAVDPTYYQAADVWTLTEPVFPEDTLAAFARAVVSPSPCPVWCPRDYQQPRLETVYINTEEELFAMPQGTV